MRQVFYILFGAIFTVAVAWAFGALTLQRLRCRLLRQERPLLSFVLGSGLLSLLVFLLCAAGFARKGVFLWVGVAVLAAAAWKKPWKETAASLPPLPALWKAAFVVPFAIYFALYLSNAMAPEISPDGVSYHLGIVARYLRGHGFHFYTTDMYANLSEGLEMLFLFAFAFGRHSSAALVHFAFLIVLPLLILSYARRAGFPIAGVCGGLLVFLSPLVGIDGISAYNDVALACVAFTLFYLLQIWLAEGADGLLLPAGLMAGFCYAIKYTGFVAVPYALAVVLWKRRRLRAPLVVALAALVMMVPWLAKNWIWLRNPFSPFLNAVFPNPFVHISFEKDYTRYFRNYDLPGYSQVPWMVTVTGALGGQFGPVFLLAPLALIALRTAAGRQILLAALVFGLPYFGNIGARFLIPAIPFVSLALGLSVGVGAFPPLTIAVLLAHAVLSWPDIIGRYEAAGGNWRLETMPVRAALRLTPEETFLNAHLSHYGTARMIDRLVPSTAHVLSLSSVAEAYTSRDILVNYQSAAAELYQDILLVPVIEDRPPGWNLSFEFAQQPLRAVRVVQTATPPAISNIWSISEFRVFDAGRELPRDPVWRLRAKPFPWDVRLAFDNSPVTRWKSWQNLFPGMFVQVDFGTVKNVDRVLLECSSDQYKIQLRLEGMDSGGTWKTLADSPKGSIVPVALSLRSGATRELKLRGIEYLLIDDEYLFAKDFHFNHSLWGLAELGQWNGARLYRID